MTDADGKFDNKDTEPGAGLSYTERSQVKKNAKPGARVVYEIIRTEGESELRRRCPRCGGQAWRQASQSAFRF